MADIFLSYKRADAAIAAKIAKYLEDQSWSVWWDTRLSSGDQWDATIEREIKLARCVVVVWTANSVDPIKARWVHTEAHEGLERNILVPCIVGNVAPPFAFKLIQAADLSTWNVVPFIQSVRATLDRGTNGHLALVNAARTPHVPAVLPMGTHGPFTWATSSILGSEPCQEDACVVWYPRLAPRLLPELELLAVLADGMGYDGSGATASQLAAQSFADRYSELRDGPIDHRLKEALMRSNGALSTAIAVNRTLDGMGASLIACALGNDRIEFISVGDSVLWLFRNGELYRLNEDHSLARALDNLVDAGQLTKEQALSDPRRFRLRSALTGGDLQMIDSSAKPFMLESGDTVLVCSTGINVLSGDDVSNVIADGASVREIPRLLTQAVAAKALPQQVNTTVLAVSYEPN